MSGASADDPLTPALAQPYAARGQAIYDDKVLNWAAGLDDISFQRVRARLQGAGVASKNWDREVKLRRDAKRTGKKAKPFDWERDLRRNEDGKVISSWANAGLIVRNWPDLESLRLNELTLEAELGAEVYKDTTATRILEDAERTFGVALAREHFDAAIEAVAEERAYHPHRQRLDGLIWDGKSRWIDLAQILDCKDPLAPRMLQIMLTSSVARTYKPGEKADQITTLFSAEQGRKKTTSLAALFYGSVYIGNIDPKNKDIDMCAGTSLCTIIDEIDEFTNRVEWPAVKRWASQQHDTFRAPYARRPRKWARQYVFAAATNHDDILRDDTGHRRFHILSVGPAGLDSRVENIKAILDQVWAEAKEIWLGGTMQGQREPTPHLWWLTEEEESIRKQGAARFEERTIIDEKVAKHVMGSGEDREFKLADVIQFGLSVEPDRVGKDPQLERRVASALRKLGFAPHSNGNERFWRKAGPRQLALNEER